MSELMREHGESDSISHAFQRVDSIAYKRFDAYNGEPLSILSIEEGSWSVRVSYDINEDQSDSPLPTVTCKKDDELLTYQWVSPGVVTCSFTNEQYRASDSLPQRTAEVMELLEWFADTMEAHPERVERERVSLMPAAEMEVRVPTLDEEIWSLSTAIFERLYPVGETVDMQNIAGYYYKFPDGRIWKRQFAFRLVTNQSGHEMYLPSSAKGYEDQEEIYTLLQDGGIAYYPSNAKTAYRGTVREETAFMNELQAFLHLLETRPEDVHINGKKRS